MGPGTSSTAKLRPAHLQMEPNLAAIEATAQLEPGWWGEGRAERRVGVPWDLEACTLRAVSSWLELLHMRCFHFTRKTRTQSRKQINSYLHLLARKLSTGEETQRSQVENLAP